MKTDTGEQFEILFEGKNKELAEHNALLFNIDGNVPVFVYDEGFINIEKDGKLLKGSRFCIFFER